MYTDITRGKSLCCDDFFISRIQRINKASSRRRMSNGTNGSSTRRPLSMISERELTEYGTF